MAKNPQQRYLEVQVKTATPEKLIIMLYDGAIRFIKLSQKHLEDQNLSEANQSLVRAQDIIFELMSSLDMQQGEIASSLFQIYNYILQQLVKANIKKDASGLAEVISLLSELRQAWTEVQSSRVSMNNVENTNYQQVGF